MWQVDPGWSPPNCSPSSTGQLMTMGGTQHKSHSFSLMKGAFTSSMSYLKLHLYPFDSLGVLSRQRNPLCSTSSLTSPTPCCVFFPSLIFFPGPFLFLHQFSFTYWVVPPLVPSRQSCCSNKQHLTKRFGFQETFLILWLFSQRCRCAARRRRSCFCRPLFLLCLLSESPKVLFHELISALLFVRQVNIKTSLQRE